MAMTPACWNARVIITLFAKVDDRGVERSFKSI
jgi:hypothetical protein